MSNANLARHTNVEIAFGGTDITKSIRPYLLSLTYTDNEEDEPDDLQIKLQDRDGIWVTSWLTDMVNAASESIEPGVDDSAKTYTVTAKSGLNVRAGAGTKYKKVGMLAFGASVTVQNTENGWANIGSGYVSMKYLKAGSGSDKKDNKNKDSNPNTAMRMQAVILRENWNADGQDKVLDCGQFELDSVDVSGSPATVTIRGTALPWVSGVRRTKKNRAWEAYSLSGIAEEIASANGMTCMFESTVNPVYERVEQFQTSDIDFLSVLCHNAGLSLKATKNILVLFEQADFESKPAAFTVKYGDGTYTKYKLSTGTAEMRFATCRVRYTDPVTHKKFTATAKASDYKEDAKDNQQLEIIAKVSSIAEAKTLAEKCLRLYNKYFRMADFTFPGNPDIVAGITVTLEGWGAWDGKYIIKQAKHTVGNSGYTTQATLRKVLGAE